MSIDTSIVKTLNSWGSNHNSLVRIFSNDLVYVMILIAVLWYLTLILKKYSETKSWNEWLLRYLTRGFINFALPAGIAIVISEVISSIYIRQRPFVAVSGVKLLVPHGVDGGMPSHHVVFMTALTASIYFYQKKIAVLLAIITLVTGIARVVAGIHYPSDIVVGGDFGRRNCCSIPMEFAQIYR